MSEAKQGPETEARDLTAFQKNILAILAQEPMYGLAIKAELEEYYGEEVNHGRLYPNLDDLVEQGLLEKSALDKRTNQYALTDRGVAALSGDLSWMLSRFVTDEDRADRIREVIDG
jgi:DNA-binding PadR family transcriptional regulator